MKKVITISLVCTGLTIGLLLNGVKVFEGDISKLSVNAENVCFMADTAETVVKVVTQTNVGLSFYCDYRVDPQLPRLSAILGEINDDIDVIVEKLVESSLETKLITQKNLDPILQSYFKVYCV